MDWFSWLSRTSLDPSLVYEYGLVFSHNELEEEDIIYFNHEFLQSMGISIAKHRLEILKLARKEKGTINPRPITRLLLAIKRTKKNLAQFVRTMIHREDKALVVVPTRPDYGTRMKAKRNKKTFMAVGNHQGRLLITNGSPGVVSGPVYGFSSPVVSDVRQKDQKVDGNGDGDSYWSSGVEEIRWDALFQDLKPT